MEGDISVKFGSEVYEVVSVTREHVLCITTAKSELNSRVRLVSRGVTYPDELKFRFTIASTPIVDEITPESGNNNLSFQMRLFEI